MGADPHPAKLHCTAGAGLSPAKGQWAPVLLRWLFPNHHQLQLFTQWGRRWTRLINDKNTCLFKNLFSDQNESQRPAPPSPLLWRHKYLQINVFVFFKHQECSTFQLLLIQVFQWWFCQRDCLCNSLKSKKGKIPHTNADKLLECKHVIYI